jgi:epoxyqueuosine reductase
MNAGQLAYDLKQKARQLGFSLAGITSPEPPAHVDVYERWLQAGKHASMSYLAENRAVERRADPRLILPECGSILVLGIPYFNPKNSNYSSNGPSEKARIAAYAWGSDYHLVLPERLQALVVFLEEQTGHPIPNRWYTDTGPILERDLAMRAGLGWIGKNTCLINPGKGSYFLLAEILLGIELPFDDPFVSDQCGSCTRCIEACPTNCIQPDRTLDASRCISFLTIENKAEIPVDLRPQMRNWVFGCDVCQMVCPWNIRFAGADGDPAFAPRAGVQDQAIAAELALSPAAFNQKYKDSPLKRAKRRGYLRNAAVAAGNSAKTEMLPALHLAMDDDEPLVREHVRWAIDHLAGSE